MTTYRLDYKGKTLVAATKVDSNDTKQLAENWVQERFAEGSRKAYSYSLTDNHAAVFGSSGHWLVRFKTVPDDKLLVVINDRPQNVYVLYKGQVNKARWKTDDGVFDCEGSRELCKAAMEAWGATSDLETPSPNGSNEFTLYYNELAERSHGWLATQPN